jgi:DMSO/TMAO reductase YedYZ heme-binding membrane subunit
MIHGTLPWYVARSSGLVAWALLAGAVVWGLLMTSKALHRLVKNNWLLDLHRWLGALALTFTAIHVVAIMLDSYVHFGLTSVLVPLATKWHPVAVAWGVASMYLLAAVELTSLVRRHIPRALWRRVHMLSFPLFVSATVHGLSAGSDARTPMVAIAAALGSSAVAALAVLRLSNRRGTRGTRPESRAANDSVRRPQPIGYRDQPDRAGVAPRPREPSGRAPRALVDADDPSPTPRVPVGAR